MRIFYFLCVIIFSLFLSCKKGNVQKDAGGNVMVQGSISLYVRCVHHSWAVSGLKVYLKKDATEFPGTDTTKYNWSETTDGGGNVLFQKLPPGNYYVYATGFDKTVGASVKGYNGVVLNSSTVANNEIYFTIMVSE